MPITLPFSGSPFRPAHLFASIVLVGLAPAVWVGANLDTWISPPAAIARLGDAPTGGNADQDHPGLPATEPMTWHPPFAPDYVMPSIGTSPGRTVPTPKPAVPGKGTPVPPTGTSGPLVPAPTGTHNPPTGGSGTRPPGTGPTGGPTASWPPPPVSPTVAPPPPPTTPPPTTAPAPDPEPEPAGTTTASEPSPTVPADTPVAPHPSGG